MIPARRGWLQKLLSKRVKYLILNDMQIFERLYHSRYSEGGWMSKFTRDERERLKALLEEMSERKSEQKTVPSTRMSPIEAFKVMLRLDAQDKRDAGTERNSGDGKGEE